MFGVQKTVLGGTDGPLSSEGFRSYHAPLGAVDSGTSAFERIRSQRSPISLFGHTYCLSRGALYNESTDSPTDACAHLSSMSKGNGMVINRMVLGATGLCAAIWLVGCPIYSNSTPASVPVLCGGVLNDCPSDECTDACIAWQCGWSGDCQDGYACENAVCVVATPDCSTTGCADGFICKLAAGTASCVARNSDGGASLNNSDATSDANPSLDAPAATEDAARPPLADATSTDSALPPVADATSSNEASDSPEESDSSAIYEFDSEAGSSVCNDDTQCASSSERCIDGRCLDVGSLCSDGTQCVVSGYRCVDGVCEPACSAVSPCPLGYSCNTALGACALNPERCSGAAPCPSGSVCVEERCVAPCAASGNPSNCPHGGEICVNGGCIPNEAASFSCKNDGESFELADTCAVGEICLHHDCYEACEITPDAGGCADPTRVCKEVTVPTGTYTVCAPPNGLGSECDVAALSPCPSGHVCVDGYCI